MKGKVILVTGAGGSIGGAIVERLAGEGALVYASDIRLPAADRRPAGTEWGAVELTDEGAVQSWAEMVGRKHGAVDGIVCVAAAFIWGTVEQASGADWDKVFAINVKGYAMVVKYGIPFMKAKGGSVVLISSQSAFIAQPSFTPGPLETVLVVPW